MNIIFEIRSRVMADAMVQDPELYTWSFFWCCRRCCIKFKNSYRRSVPGIYKRTEIRNTLGLPPPAIISTSFRVHWDLSIVCLFAFGYNALQQFRGRMQTLLSMHWCVLLPSWGLHVICSDLRYQCLPRALDETPLPIFLPQIGCEDDVDSTAIESMKRKYTQRERERKVERECFNSEKIIHRKI